MWLPELPRLLAARASLAPHHHALLQRLDIAPAGRGAWPRYRPGHTRSGCCSARVCAADDAALDHLLLQPLDLFLFIFWLPEVLHLIGMTPAQAVFATSLYPLGGIFAVLYLGWAIDRFGARRSLAAHYAVGIVFIALISLVAMPYLALLAVVLLAGLTVIGSQTGLNGACGKLYPARMRTSGYGLHRRRAIGRHRRGAARRVSAGDGLPPTYVFLSACLFALIAAIATAFLALPGGRPAASRRCRWHRKSLRLRPVKDPGLRRARIPCKTRIATSVARPVGLLRHYSPMPDSMETPRHIHCGYNYPRY